MKIKKYYTIVEYNTLAGYLRSWEGYAEDESEAIDKAIEYSYEDWSNNEHYNATVSVSIDETNFIEESADI